MCSLSMMASDLDQIDTCSPRSEVPRSPLARVLIAYGVEFRFAPKKSETKRNEKTSVASRIYHADAQAPELPSHSTAQRTAIADSKRSANENHEANCEHISDRFTSLR